MLNFEAAKRELKEEIKEVEGGDIEDKELRKRREWILQYRREYNGKLPDGLDKYYEKDNVKAGDGEEDDGEETKGKKGKDKKAKEKKGKKGKGGKKGADGEDGAQLLAETSTYSNRGLDSPCTRGDELEQGARVDASGLGKHVCKHPSGTYMIQSA